MSRKSKGINAERELIHLFWRNGWGALRIAGSGSISYPSADVFASNSFRRIAIEAKITKDQSKYFSLDELNQLKEFSEHFAAEPWLAIKFKGHDWLFVRIESLKQTKNHFVVTADLAKKDGFSFLNLINLEAKGF